MRESIQKPVIELPAWSRDEAIVDQALEALERAGVRFYRCPIRCHGPCVVTRGRFLNLPETAPWHLMFGLGEELLSRVARWERRGEPVRPTRWVWERTHLRLLGSVKDPWPFADDHEAREGQP
jgi:hypothetical protein